MVSGTPGIICVGLAVMDQIYSVERLPEAPAKHFATDLPGGRRRSGGERRGGNRSPRW